MYSVHTYIHTCIVVGRGDNKTVWWPRIWVVMTFLYVRARGNKGEDIKWSEKKKKKKTKTWTSTHNSACLYTRWKPDTMIHHQQQHNSTVFVVQYRYARYNWTSQNTSEYLIARTCSVRPPAPKNMQLDKYHQVPRYQYILPVDHLTEFVYNTV